MKAFKLVLLFFFFSSIVHAQTGTIKIQKPKPEPEVKKDTVKNSVSMLDVYYGYRTPFQNFQNQLNTVKFFKPGAPLQLIGFGITEYFHLSRNENFYGHFLYHQVIPQKILINDSIHCKITGFVYSAAFGGAIQTKSKKMFTMFYLGFNTGRLRLLPNELVRQKNPFFSPKAGIQPKILIGKLTITLIAEYEYDISKLNWRKTLFTTNNKTTISKLNQTSLTTLIGISYRFFHHGTLGGNDDGAGM